MSWSGASRKPPATGFLIQRYGAATKPDELIVNRVADPAAVRRARRRPGEGAAAALRITPAKRGLKRALLELCRENYEYRREAGSARGEVTFYFMDAGASAILSGIGKGE